MDISQEPMTRAIYEANFTWQNYLAALLGRIT